MNRILAETLSLINVILAIATFVIGIVCGYWIFNGSVYGIALGGFLGFIFAAMTSGVISYLALIERHLAKIAGNEQTPNIAKDRDRVRRDPSL